MDNNFTQNTSVPGGNASFSGNGVAAVTEQAATDPASVIEQVRELLFGDHRRMTEGSLTALESKIAALTATVEARFADLERRLSEAKAETEHARESGVEAIGAAIAELGDKIKGLVAKPPV